MIKVRQDFVEKLFVHLYCDLGQRTEAMGEFQLYNQLNMARLIRQLLMDGSSGVFSLANRELRLPITFTVPKLGPKPSDLRPIPDVYSNQNYSLDMFPPGYYLHPYNIDGFLKHTSLVLADKKVTISDIVSYVANSYGGVHLEPTVKDERKLLLARFNDFLMVGNDGIVLSQINTIASVTLHALAPLRFAIEDKYNQKADILGSTTQTRDGSRNV